MKIPQYSLGAWVGAVKTQFSRAQFYTSLFPLAFSMIAARSQLLEWFPWLPFPVIIAAVILVYLMLMLLDYIFVLKPEIEFGTAQGLKHKNPAMDILKRMDDWLKTQEENDEYK